MSNITKIQYIRIFDKLYRVTDISFFHMAMTVEEIDPAATMPPEDDIFDISDFEEFRITIKTKHKCEIIQLSDLRKLAATNKD